MTGTELVTIEEGAQYWYGRLMSGHSVYKECKAAITSYHPQSRWKSFVGKVQYPTPLGVPVTDIHYIFFKKFLINHFNREYKKGPGIRLVEDAVKYVMDKRAVLSIVIANGEIYEVAAKDFYQWAHEHNTMTDASWSPSIRELTAPVGIMRKVYPAND